MTLHHLGYVDCVADEVYYILKQIKNFRRELKRLGNKPQIHSMIKISLEYAKIKAQVDNVIHATESYYEGKYGELQMLTMEQRGREMKNLIRVVAPNQHFGNSGKIEE